MKTNQEVKTPRAYLIAENEVSDPALFKKYADQVPATLAPFGGQYLVRGGEIHAVEGEAPKRFVIIAFDSLEKARGWEYSQAYEAIKEIRHKAAKSRVFIVEGVAPRMDD